MPDPIFNQEYTVIVEKGDTLSKLAGIFYHDVNLWPIIWRANVTKLRSGDPNLIYPGEEIFIPPRNYKRFQEELPEKSSKEMTIIVDGVELPVVSGRILRTMNTASDMWEATIAWNPGEDKKLDDATRPYGYKSAAAYAGGKLLVSGIITGVGVSISENGRVKKLTGYSTSIDAVDSNVKAPYEVNNVSLKQRAEELLHPLGVGVEFVDTFTRVPWLDKNKYEEALLAYEGTKFSRVTADQNDTIFDHLASLASQRSYLISSDNQGNIAFIRANTNGKPIGTIQEEPGQFQGLGALEYAAAFDGRKRFRSYKVTSKTPGKKSTVSVAVSKDNQVARPRLKNIQANDIQPGELQKYADWQRSKFLADALTIPFPVSTWYGPDGNLWTENTLLTVVSPTLFIDEGFTFLIKQVEFIYEAGGIRAMLSLVPPQVYSGEELVEPWV